MKQSLGHLEGAQLHAEEPAEFGTDLGSLVTVVALSMDGMVGLVCLTS